MNKHDSVDRSAPVAGDGVTGAGDGHYDPRLVVTRFRQCVSDHVTTRRSFRHVLVGSVRLWREKRGDAVNGLLVNCTKLCTRLVTLFVNP